MGTEEDDKAVVELWVSTSFCKSVESRSLISFRDDDENGHEGNLACAFSRTSLTEVVVTSAISEKISSTIDMSVSGCTFLPTAGPLPAGSCISNFFWLLKSSFENVVLG